MNTRRIASLLALIAFLPGAALAAEDEGPGKVYVSFDIGQARADAQASYEFIGPTYVQKRGTSTGYKALIGVQFIRFVAVELGYVNFGDNEFNIPYTCPANVQGPCSTIMRSRLSGPFMNAVGSLPFAQRWSLNARAGIFQADLKAEEIDQNASPQRNDRSDDNFALTFGAGVSVKLTQNLDLSLDWNRYFQMGLGLTLGGGAISTDLGDSTLTSLGVRWRF
jgi:opacity protein-like surface antigen